MSQPTRPSLATVAKAVGVSRTVVYTVLNGREGKGVFVSEKTRDRVLQTAKELGYVAPKSAKELFSGRSDTIGVLVHDLVPPFSDLVHHLLVEAKKHGLEVMPYVTGADPAAEEQYLSQSRDGRVDAMIAIAVVDGSPERYLRFATTPPQQKILAYCEPLPGISTVHFDEAAAGRLAARHLLERCRQRLAYFGGHSNFVRDAAFMAYAQEYGKNAPERFIPASYTSEFSALAKMAEGFLEACPRADGVFASNDFLAIALLSVARGRGIRVPEDLAIIGCDNIEACQYTTPRITSIDTGRPALAKAMIAQVVRMINGQNVGPVHVSVPVKLALRESTGGRGLSSRRSSRAGLAQKDMVPSGDYALSGFSTRRDG